MMSQDFAARVSVRRMVVCAVLAVASVLALQHASTARADGPGSGTPYVATRGRLLHLG